MHLDILFRRHFWLVKAFGVAVAAGFAGSTVVTLVGSQAAYAAASPGAAPPAAEAPGDDAEEDEDAGTPAPAAARASRDEVQQDILARDIFCPDCVDEPAAAPGSIGEAEPAPVLANVALSLMATMEAEPIEASLATLYDPEKGVTGLFAVGDTVLPGVVLASVGGGVVALDVQGRQHWLRVGEAPTVAPSPPAPVKAKPVATTRAAPRNAVASSSLPGATDAIDCQGSDSCTVERAFVEELMKNPAALATQAAVRPSSDGFTFARVRKGSLPDLLGLKAGDVLTEVNGEALDSIDKAISLVTKLRYASNLDVRIVRGGKPLRKAIRIS